MVDNIGFAAQPPAERGPQRRGELAPEGLGNDGDIEVHGLSWYAESDVHKRPSGEL